MINDGLPTFFTQLEYPDYWLLPEVLYWIAFNRVPRAEYNYEGIECRESPWTFRNRSLSVSEWLLEPLSKSECKDANLPPDPRRTRASLSRQENGDVEVFEKDENQFLLSLTRHLDLYLSKLHLVLSDGELIAEGVRVRSWHEDNISKRIEAKLGYESELSANAYDKIPADRWIRSAMLIDECMLKDEPFTFALVRIPVHDVLRIFPPTPGSQVKISSNGRGLLHRGLSSPTGSSVGGRPAKNWNEVAAYIAKRLLEHGGIPSKQDAFAHEIVTWYEESFDQSIGPSTVKNFITTFYKSDEIPKI